MQTVLRDTLITPLIRTYQDRISEYSFVRHVYVICKHIHYSLDRLLHISDHLKDTLKSPNGHLESCAWIFINTFSLMYRLLIARKDVY